MPTIKFERVTIKDNLKITLAKDQVSPLAEATFNCTSTLTGRDTAAGNSYAAWLRTREAAKAARPTPHV